MKEHRDACQKGALETSALAEHARESHHPIKWEETTVVDLAMTPKELLLKEAIHIWLLKTVINRGGTGAAWMLDGSPGSREAEATRRFWWCAPTQLPVTEKNATHRYKCSL